MLLDLIDNDILFKQLGPQAGPLKQIFHDILGPLDATLDASGKALMAFTSLTANGSLTSPKNVLDPSGAGKIQTNLISAAQAVSFGKQSVMQGAAAFVQQSQQVLA